MNFEQVTRNAQAEQRRIILADPASLRECADRLEASARGARHGESVLCELTSGVVIIFKPESDAKFFPEARETEVVLPHFKVGEN